MCKANLEVLQQTINTNLGKTKSLGEWREMINSRLPKMRRLTRREVSFGFRVLRMKHIYEVEKDLTTYHFLEPQAQVVSIQ